MHLVQGLDNKIYNYMKFYLKYSLQYYDICQFRRYILLNSKQLLNLLCKPIY